jgi:two-component system NtrC family sensor kinase
MLTAVTCLAIAILVYVKGAKNKINRIWSIFALGVAIYGFGGFKASTAKDPSAAFFWWQIAYIGVIMLPVLITHFIYSFLGINRPHFIKVIYFLNFIMLASDIFCKDLFVGHVSLFFVNSKWFKPAYFIYPPGPLHIIHTLLFYFGLITLAHIDLIKGYRQATSLKRHQIKYFLFATISGFTGGGTSYLPCFGISLYPVFNIAVAFCPLIIAYAILKYRLMDITVAITRTGIFVAVYTLVLGLPFAVAVWLKSWLIQAFGAGWWMSPLVLMAVLATAGPFIYIYISRRAEERLLKEQRRYQNTLKQASLGMTRIRNLRRLLDLITHIITKTVRISYAAIYLYDKQADKYVLQVSRDKGRISIPNLNSDNPLVAWIMVKREPLVYEEVKRQLEDTNDATYRHLEENMRLLNASVVIPSLLEDKFLGFIVLGDKLSGQIYTPDDLNVFQVLASQAALAIENAQFYEETQKMQEQIAQAEKMATIGTMADGLSHQINNRFYALSLIAGDTIDTIKVTDTSKCTPEVKEMLDSINHALGRIQTNVMQGGEVVKGILKYTRKGDESFGALTLDQILDGTLEMVQYKVKLSEIDLMRDYPKDIPRIKGNLVQLQEAFFNFIDNAYDAIVERRTTLKEDGYRGKITVSAQQKDSALGIVVEDNGMGIKDDNLNKIFTPFFTTKTSARRGTGLGLYVIRRIITDTHKGKIALESSYGFGTRFILELPIAK